MRQSRREILKFEKVGNTTVVTGGCVTGGGCLMVHLDELRPLIVFMVVAAKRSEAGWAGSKWDAFQAQPWLLEVIRRLDTLRKNRAKVLKHTPLF